MNWVNTTTSLLDLTAGAAQFGVNWLVQSTLLIVAGLAVGQLMRNRGAAAQSIVCRTTLAAVLLCPLATLALSSAGVRGWSIELPAAWSYREPPAALSSLSVAQPAVHPSEPALASGVISSSGNTSGSQSVVIGSTLPSVDESLSVTPPVEPPGKALTPNAADLVAIQASPAQTPTSIALNATGIASLIAVAAWFVVACVLGAKLGASWWRLTWLRRLATSAGSGTIRKCEEIAELLEVRAPEVLRSPYLPSPCLAGISSPAVLLPEDQTHYALRDVLIHELAHLRRRDCHWNLLRRVGGCLFFFQPLLWVLARRMDAAAEDVCDDYVVQYGGDRLEYAHRLVDIAELSTAPIAAAGVGMVSLKSMLAQRVERIMDTSRTLSTRVSNLLLVVVIAGGLLAATGAGLLGLTQAPSEADDVVALADAAEDENDAKDFDLVRGIVLDPDGNPIAGVTIEAQRPIFDPDAPKKPLALTESDADGAFLLKYPTWEHVTIVASAKGYGADLLRLDLLKQDERLTLNLTKDDLPIRGRVVDLEGNPIPDVKVSIGGFAKPKSGALDEWIASLKRGEIFWEASNRCFEGTTPQIPANIPNSVKTNADGEFSLRGIGKERRVSLALEGPTIAYTRAIVATRDMPPVVANDGLPHPEWSRKRTVFGARFKIVASPTQPITGEVRDAKTGKPLVGVAIESYRMSQYGVSGERLIRTRSDQQGRYLLVGMPKSEGKRIIAIPNDQQPYLMREFDVPDQPGLEPVELDLELHRGVWITGRLTDKQTGQPIGRNIQANAQYFPYRSNTTASALPEYDANGNSNGYQNRYRIADDGQFRLVGLPGKAIVGAVVWGRPYYPRGQGSELIEGADQSGHFATYRNGVSASTKHPTVMQEIDIPKDAKEFHLDFELDRGRSVQITPVAPNGELLTGLRAAGVAHREHWTDVDQAPFDLTALALGEHRTLLLHSTGRQLGKAVQVSETGSPDKMTVRLQPCVTVLGQLVDDNQQPISGARVRFSPNPGGDYSPELKLVHTDAEGRFKHDGVLPGASYNVMAESVQQGFATLVKKLAVSPGETIDLGTIDVTSKARPDPVRTNAAAVAPAFRYQGSVVDADGQPLPNAKLHFCYWYSDQSVPANSKPLGVTGADGKFDFTLAKSEFRRTGDSVPPWLWASIVAVADGHGAAWAPSMPFETTGALKQESLDRSAEQGLGIGHRWKRLYARRGPLRLPRDDHPITGRLVDVDGQPVAGATIRVTDLRTGENNSLDALNEKAQSEGADLVRVSRAADLRLYGPYVSAIFKGTKTDDKGRFVLHGIGRHRMVTMVASAEGFETTELYARTMDAQAVTLAHSLIGNARMHGTTFTEVLGPSRAVEGIVRDANTHQPLPGVLVSSQQVAFTIPQQATHRAGSDHVRAITDSQGRYRMNGLPPAQSTPLRFTPSPQQGYLVKNAAPVDTRGDVASPVTRNIDLTPAGALIRGRVVDRKTGKGVPGSIQYLAAKSHQKSPASSMPFGMHSDIRADTEGRFQITVPKGKGYIAFTAFDQGYKKQHPQPKDAKETTGLLTYAMAGNAGYHSLVKVDIDGRQQDQKIELLVDRGQVITGHVLDPNGKKLTNAIGMYAGRIEHAGWQIFDAGKFTVQHFDPKRPRWLAFYLPEEKLAGKLLVKQAPNKALTVQLQPWATVTGRVVDAEGEPLANVRLVSHSLAGPSLASETPVVEPALPLPMTPKTYEAVTTDSQGEFTQSGLAPGVAYDINGYRRGRGVDFLSGELAKGLKLKPGETRDLGDIELKQVKPAMVSQPRPVGKPIADAKSDAGSAESRTISGTIRLPNGSPAAGARVAAIGLRMAGVPQAVGEVLAEATADAKGAFRLSLPADVTSRSHRFTNLIARTDDTGIAWRKIDLNESATEFNINLVEQAPIAGKLVDIEGQPAAGVQLVYQSVMRRSSQGTPSRNGVGFRDDAPPAAWLSPVVSDSDGRFTLPGVPADCGVYLVVTNNEHFAQQHIALNTGQPEQRGDRDATYRSLTRNAKPGEELVLPLSPAQVFEGTVTYEDTGKRVPDARISIWASQQEFAGSMHSIEGRADERGEYRITPSPGVRFGLTAFPPKGTPYLARQTPYGDAIRWQNGDRTKRVDLSLPRGVLVKGVITELASGKPVVGAMVQYAPESLNNPNQKDGILTGWQDRHATDDEGRFSITVLPGPGRLLVEDNQGRYVTKMITQREISRNKPGGRRNYVKAAYRLEPPVGSDAVDVAIKLTRCALAKGRILNQQGTPVREALVLSAHNRMLNSLTWRGQVQPTQGGNYQVSGMKAGETTTAYFLNPEQKTGATQVVHAGQTADAVLTPCGSAVARFVNPAGEPHVGRRIVPHMVITPGPSEYDSQAARRGQTLADGDSLANIDRKNYGEGPKTNQQGTVTLPTLIPGATYRLQTFEDGKPKILAEFKVKSGEQIDLGELTMDLDN